MIYVGIDVAKDKHDYLLLIPMVRFCTMCLQYRTT